MNVLFDPNTHTYTVDGIRLPSVTEITRFLSFDYKSDKPWLAQIAAHRGTAVHEACMLIDYGEEPEETPETSGYLKAYRRFLADYQPEWELIEHPMGSIDLGYAGSLDRMGHMCGNRVLLDIKTGSTLHHSAIQAQLGGYWWLLLDQEGKSVEALYALRLDKSGIYELVQEPNGDHLFDACMILHKATERKKRR